MARREQFREALGAGFAGMGGLGDARLAFAHVAAEELTWAEGGESLAPGAGDQDLQGADGVAHVGLVRLLLWSV